MSDERSNERFKVNYSNEINGTCPLDFTTWRKGRVCWICLQVLWEHNFW